MTGHDSRLVPGVAAGYSDFPGVAAGFSDFPGVHRGKREADYGYGPPPQCQEVVKTECQKRPHQHVGLATTQSHDGVFTLL